MDRRAAIGVALAPARAGGDAYIAVAPRAKSLDSPGIRPAALGELKEGEAHLALRSRAPFARASDADVAVKSAAASYHDYWALREAAVIAHWREVDQRERDEEDLNVLRAREATAGRSESIPLPPPSAVPILQAALTALATIAAKRAKPVEDDGPTCVVCLTNSPDVVFRPCNHLKVCGACTLELAKKDGFQCPECRTRVDDILPIFV